MAPRNAPRRRRRPGEAAVKSQGRIAEAQRWQVDDLLVDAGTRRVHRGGADLAITRLSFDLLLALVRVSPQLLRFDELMEQVWPGVVVSPETLTQRIKLLRQVLGDSAEEPRYILAVRGVGYRLATAARPVLAVDVAAAGAAGPAAAASRSRPRLLVAAAAAAAALALVLVVGISMLRGGQGAPTAAPAIPASVQIEVEHLIELAESVVDGSAEGFQASISLFDEVLARDPRSARALSGRAMNRAALEWNGSALARGLQLAERDALEALALDRGERRAMTVLGSIHALRGEWDSSETRFEAAIAAGAPDPEVLARHAVSLLLPTGQLRRAAAQMEQAHRLDQTSGFTTMMLAMVREVQGDSAEAIRLIEQSRSRGADPRVVAKVAAAAAARAGRFQTARDRVIEALPPELKDGAGELALRQGFAALEDPSLRPAAVAALREMMRAPAWQGAEIWNRRAVLQLYAQLGAINELYGEYWRMASRQGGRFVPIPALVDLWAPEMRAFRQHPQFQTLAEHLELLDYWKTSGPPDLCRLAADRLICE